MCNWFQNILRVLDFCNALLKFTVNMHGMHLKDEKDKMIVKAFKIFFFWYHFWRKWYIVRALNFGRDLKPGLKVTLDPLRQGINYWDCYIYFISPEN